MSVCRLLWALDRLKGLRPAVSCAAVTLLYHSQFMLSKIPNALHVSFLLAALSNVTEEVHAWKAQKAWLTRSPAHTIEGNCTPHEHLSTGYERLSFHSVDRAHTSPINSQTIKLWTQGSVVAESLIPHPRLLTEKLRECLDVISVASLLKTTSNSPMTFVVYSTLKPPKPRPLCPRFPWRYLRWSETYCGDCHVPL